MPRTRGFEPDEALDSAMTLFWRLGYSGTSVAQLVKETGVNRHSLYETFGDKQALYLKALQRFDKFYFGRMLEDLSAEPRGLPALERFLRNLADRLRDPRAVNGCMMLKSASNPVEVGEEIAAYVNGKLKQLYRSVRDEVRTGQAAGDIRADLDADEVTRFLSVVAQGMTLMRGISDDRRYADQSIGQALDSLRSGRA